MTSSVAPGSCGPATSTTPSGVRRWLLGAGPERRGRDHEHRGGVQGRPRTRRRPPGGCTTIGVSAASRSGSISSRRSMSNAWSTPARAAWAAAADRPVRERRRNPNATLSSWNLISGNSPSVRTRVRRESITTAITRPSSTAYSTSARPPSERRSCAAETGRSDRPGWALSALQVIRRIRFSMPRCRESSRLDSAGSWSPTWSRSVWRLRSSASSSSMPGVPAGSTATRAAARVRSIQLSTWVGVPWRSRICRPS